MRATSSPRLLPVTTFLQRRARLLSIIAVVCITLVVIGVAARLILMPAHAQTDYWTAYMGSNARTSYNPNETTITPATAPNLKLHWKHSDQHHVFTQPILANGYVYWGAYDGYEYASDPATGNVVWKTYVGMVVSACTGKAMGPTSTAAAVTENVNGTPTSVLILGGGDAHVYMLNALTGAVIWSTSLGDSSITFLWDSPAVYNGSVYIGIAGFGDCPPPKVQGQFFQLNATTGAIQNTFAIVPSGCTGAGVWGSPAIDEQTGTIFFGTANAGTCATTESMQESIVSLSASNLTLLGTWEIKQLQAADIDFGTTPTLFSATISGVNRQLVGLADKNGVYYAFDRSNVSAGPVWISKLANGGSSPTTGTISSSAWDGTNIYAAGGKTTINGVTCAGSLRALNPSTGAVVFQTCLSTGPVLGSVMAVPGLVVVGANATLDVIATGGAQAGQVVYAYTDPATTSYFKGAATIANGVIYVGDWNGHLDAFGL